MKIFNKEQIKQWDEYTMAHEHISAIDLMERAAMACTNWLCNNISSSSFIIFCGKGNNGGDGLAIARQLFQRHKKVDLFILNKEQTGSENFEINLTRLHQVDVPISYINNEQDLPDLHEGQWVIECLFGFGLNRPLTGLAEAVVQHINGSKAKVVAIDVPAGLFVDASSAGNTIIEAATTLTFQCLKLAYLVPQNAKFTGSVHVLDIGLAEDFKKTVDTPFEITGIEQVNRMYKPRDNFSHKGTFGHSLILGGSKGKMGAAILSSRSCLRAGAGLVTSMVPEWGLPIIQSTFPEAMAVGFNDFDTLKFENYKAIGIGPGAGTGEQVTDLLKKVLSNYFDPMVIDADFLNILSVNKGWLNSLPPGSILTPHPKEFERLFGKNANDFDKLELALKKAVELKVIIVLKGHRTFIATPDGKGFFNSTGNAGMATAGSGDVLAGILTSLLSQGYRPEEAAIFGTYLHGLAGDLAAEQLGMEAMIAGDLIDYLGKAYLQVSNYTQKDPWKGV